MLLAEVLHPRLFPLRDVGPRLAVERLSMPPSKLENANTVSIVGGNLETVDGLQAYFERAGIMSRARRGLHLLPASTTSLVLFPDELDPVEVVAHITALRSTGPKMLLIVVTAVPRHLQPALDPDEHSLLPILVPKPAFGWVILDAIRAHAETEVS